jgi:hypothetical protein
MRVLAGNVDMARLAASKAALEAAHDGPLPPDGRHGGGHAFQVREVICRFWACTDQARRQLRALRAARAATQSGADAPMPIAASRQALDGFQADLRTYRAERHRCMARLSRLMHENGKPSLSGTATVPLQGVSVAHRVPAKPRPR